MCCITKGFLLELTQVYISAGVLVIQSETSHHLSKYYKPAMLQSSVPFTYLPHITYLLMKGVYLYIRSNWRNEIFIIYMSKNLHNENAHLFVLIHGKKYIIPFCFFADVVQTKR